MSLSLIQSDDGTMVPVDHHDRVSFQARTRSISTSRKCSTRLNVVARSTLMRAFRAMNNAVVRPGYL